MWEGVSVGVAPVDVTMSGVLVTSMTMDFAINRLIGRRQVGRYIVLGSLISLPASRGRPWLGVFRHHTAAGPDRNHRETGS